MKAGLGGGLLDKAVTTEGMATLLYLRASETGMSDCASGLILESGFHQLPGWYGQAPDYSAGMLNILVSKYWLIASAVKVRKRPKLSEPW